MNIEVDGIRIAINAGLEFTQTYELLGGTVTQRMQSGKAIKQSHFNKIRTVLSGQGWIPAGLDGLDYSNPLLLKCAAPRSISSRLNHFTIPSGRRHDSDFEPRGYGLVDGSLVKTSITIHTDIVSLSAIPGASSYQVYYYPEIWVFAEPPQIQANMTNAEFSWMLTCEEV